MKKNIVHWGITLFAGCCACAFLTVRAGAAEPGFYLNLDAGANWIPDTEVSFQAPGGAEVSTPVDFNTGFRGGVSVGYNFNPFVGAEFETAFLYNEGKGVDAWLGQVPFLANVIFRFENSSRWVPYVGAGGGGVAAILDLSEGDANETDSDIVPAWQFQAGLRYHFNERSWFGVGYKYLGVKSPEFSLGGSDQDFDTIHNHAVMASFGLSF